MTWGNLRAIVCVLCVLLWWGGESVGVVVVHYDYSGVTYLFSKSWLVKADTERAAFPAVLSQSCRSRHRESAVCAQISVTFSV